MLFVSILIIRMVLEYSVPFQFYKYITIAVKHWDSRVDPGGGSRGSGPPLFFGADPPFFQ